LKRAVPFEECIDNSLAEQVVREGLADSPVDKM
jgi:hypothetical protein